MINACRYKGVNSEETETFFWKGLKICVLEQVEQ